MEPTWASIPPKFRIELAKLLDFKSRISYRRCSLEDSLAVDLAPFNIENLMIHVLKIVPPGAQMFQFKTSKSCKNVPLEEAIMGLWTIFKHGNSKVDYLDLGEIYDDDKNDVLNDLMTKLVDYMTDQKGPNAFLRARKVSWQAPVTSEFPKILKNIHPENLKDLCLNAQTEIPNEVYQEIIATDQWRNLRAAKIKGEVEDGLSSFYHLDNVDVNVKNLDPQDLADFIKNYHSKNLPHESFFAFHAEQVLEEGFEAKVLNYLNQHLKTQQIEDFIGQVYLNIEIPNSPYVLTMTLRGSPLAAGMICTKADCDVEMLHKVLQIRFWAYVN